VRGEGYRPRRFPPQGDRREESSQSTAGGKTQGKASLDKGVTLLRNPFVLTGREHLCSHVEEGGGVASEYGWTGRSILKEYPKTREKGEHSLNLKPEGGGGRFISTPWGGSMIEKKTQNRGRNPLMEREKV